MPDSITRVTFKEFEMAQISRQIANTQKSAGNSGAKSLLCIHPQFLAQFREIASLENSKLRKTRQIVRPKVTLSMTGKFQAQIETNVLYSYSLSLTGFVIISTESVKSRFCCSDVMAIMCRLNFSSAPESCVNIRCCTLEKKVIYHQFWCVHIQTTLKQATTVQPIKRWIRGMLIDQSHLIG